jgi:hypothetical protein
MGTGLCTLASGARENATETRADETSNSGMTIRRNLKQRNGITGSVLSLLPNDRQAAPPKIFPQIEAKALSILATRIPQKTEIDNNPDSGFRSGQKSDEPDGV